MPWLRAGTVAVTNGSTAVTGTNADFAANARTGDSFVGPDGLNYEVANVASATVISILPAYKGPTASGAAYAIMPVQGYDKMLSDAFNNLNNQFGSKLAALGTTGNYDVLPVDKGGTGGTTPAAARTGLGLGTSATLSVTTIVERALPGAMAGKVADAGFRGISGFLDLRGSIFETGTPTDLSNTGFITGFATASTLGIPSSALSGSVYVHLTVVTPLNGVVGAVGATTIRTARGYDREVVSYATSATTWSAWSEPNVRGGANSTITSLSGLTTALSVAQGGTGNNTGTASKLAGAGILGTVSQSGGTPTGSIIEKGSTATGEYTKFADGTMICRHTYTASTSVDLPFNGAFVSGYIPWIFPAAFVASPSVIVTPRGDTALFGMVGPSGSGTMENIRIGQSVSAGAATRSANFVAIGRWF